MPKRNRRYPQLYSLVVKAVKTLSETKGSTDRRVIDQVCSMLNEMKLKSKPKNVGLHVRKALKHGVQAGALLHRSGRYMPVCAGTNAHKSVRRRRLNKVKQGRNRSQRLNSRKPKMRAKKSKRKDHRQPSKLKKNRRSGQPNKRLKRSRNVHGLKIRAKRKQLPRVRKVKNYTSEPKQQRILPQNNEEPMVVEQIQSNTIQTRSQRSTGSRTPHLRSVHGLRAAPAVEAMAVERLNSEEARNKNKFKNKMSLRNSH